MVKINKICSIQGSSVENEDIVGSQNQYFWIIDGATDLYNSIVEMLKKIMNYIFEDDGNVSEVIGALDIIHHLDKIAHTTQSIYKWIMYRKYGNIN